MITAHDTDKTQGGVLSTGGKNGFSVFSIYSLLSLSKQLHKMTNSHKLTIRKLCARIKYIYIYKQLS